MVIGHCETLVSHLTKVTKGFQNRSCKRQRNVKSIIKGSSTSEEKVSSWERKAIFKFLHQLDLFKDFPGGSDGKASVYNAGDLGSIPGSGRSSREGNGNPLQYSCLENPMDGEAW